MSVYQLGCLLNEEVTNNVVAEKPGFLKFGRSHLAMNDCSMKIKHSHDRDRDLGPVNLFKPNFTILT